MRTSLLCLSVMLAAPAAAQDVAAEFADAQARFIIPGQETQDPTGHDDAVIALLPSLEGQWIEASVLTNGAPLSAELVTAGCERQPVRLQITAPRSFSLLVGDGSPGPLEIRHDYLFGNLFQRNVPETPMLERLGMNGAEVDVPPSIFRTPGLRGEVMLFHPSPDILVFSADGQVTIFARCP